MSSNLYTYTIQSVINFASIHAELMSLAGVGGYSNEPGLTLANDVLQDLICRGNAWKFNRVEMPMFVTSPFRQDYQFGGAVGFTSTNSAGIALKTASTPGVSQAAFTVTVNFLEPHNMTSGQTFYMLGNVDAAFNSTYSQTPTASGYSGGWTIVSTPTTTSLTLTFLNSATTTSGAPGITNFAWLESGTMQEINSTSPVPRIWNLEAVNDIQPTSLVSSPMSKVAVMTDNGDGTLKLRFQYVPGTVIYGVNLVYQARPVIKSALTGAGTGDWSPFPDQLSYVYRQMFLAHAYRYMNSSKAEVEYAKAQAQVAKALGQNDSEESDQHITPSQSLIDPSYSYDEF